MSVAIITGASRGLGHALAWALAERGWSLVIDARGADALERARAELEAATAARAEEHGQVVAVPGDVSDHSHRQALADAAQQLGGVDLVVNNASVLGPSPLPPLTVYPLDALADVYRVNVLGPLGVVQATADQLRRRRGAVLNVTSDAAVEAYEGWGGYGSSKAALEQVSAVLAVELPDIAVWWVDPGDLRTQMHADAFPGEDISDRPLPESVVPGLLHLIEHRLPSGRYRGSQLVDAASTGAR